VARLLNENREFMAPVEPVRDERFFTSEGQGDRIEENFAGFAIVVDDVISGGVTIWHAGGQRRVTARPREERI
jgi:hypothetical protein